LRFPALLPDTPPPLWLIILEASAFLLFTVGAWHVFWGILLPPVFLVYGGMFLAHCWAVIFLLYKFLLVPILPLLGFIVIVMFLPDLPVLGFVDPRSPGMSLLFLCPALMTILWWGGYLVLGLVERRSKVTSERK
jgi:hypothetical protein